MFIKTKNLTGPALDWAVLRAVNEEYLSRGKVFRCESGEWEPTRRWDQCGPLIDEYRVSLGRKIFDSDTVIATNGGIVEALEVGEGSEGPTVLIAACRSIVYCVLGEEVYVPDALVEG